MNVSLNHWSQSASAHQQNLTSSLSSSHTATNEGFFHFILHCLSAVAMRPLLYLQFNSFIFSRCSPFHYYSTLSSTFNIIFCYFINLFIFYSFNFLSLLPPNFSLPAKLDFSPFVLFLLHHFLNHQERIHRRNSVRERIDALPLGLLWPKGGVASWREGKWKPRKGSVKERLI